MLPRDPDRRGLQVAVAPDPVPEEHRLDFVPGDLDDDPRREQEKSVNKEARDGEVSEKPAARTVVSCFGVPGRGRTVDIAHNQSLLRGLQCFRHILKPPRRPAPGGESLPVQFWDLLASGSVPHAAPPRRSSHPNSPRPPRFAARRALCGAVGRPEPPHRALGEGISRAPLRPALVSPRITRLHPSTSPPRCWRWRKTCWRKGIRRGGSLEACCGGSRRCRCQRGRWKRRPARIG